MKADSGKSTGLPARAYPPYTAPGVHHAVKLRYGVDNPGEVGSTVVYPYGKRFVTKMGPIRKLTSAPCKLTSALRKLISGLRKELIFFLALGFRGLGFRV